MSFLTDVCSIQYGYPFDSALFNSNDGTPLVRIRDVVPGFSNTYTTEKCDECYYVENDDMLIGMDGEFNIAYWKGGHAYLNQRVCKIIPKEGVHKRYLFYQLMPILKRIENRTAFVTVKHLSAKELNKIELSLPDFPRQQRIADTLDKVSEGIGLCRKMLGKLDLMVKAKFVEMFGDAKVNPFDWVQSTIGASCTLKSGTSLPLEKENEGGNIPYVKVGDMNYVGNEKYITTSSRFVTEETAGVGIFPVGSVVFPKRGGAIGTNKKRLTSVPICADLNVMGVIPGKQLLPQYLLAYFDTIDLGLLNNGSSVPQINNKDIAPLIISIPPIELQEQFATFVSKIDKSRLTIQQVLSKMELEQKVLMQECFGRHVALNILS